MLHHCAGQRYHPALLPYLFFHKTIDDYRYYAFIAAIILYGAFGSPTPDTIGLSEICVAALLIFAIGPANLWKSGSFFLPSYFSWENAGKAALCYSLTIPLLYACLAGNNYGYILRDGIAALFLLLPLLGKSLMLNNKDRFQGIVIAIMAAALFFAWRSLSPAYGFMPAWPLSENTALYYLSNAPTLLFSALFLTSLLFWQIQSKQGLLSKTLKLAFLALLILLLLGVMAQTLQRATLGLYGLGTGVLLLLSLRHAPGRILVAGAIFALPLLYYFGPDITAVIQALSQKTHDVGINKRTEEIQAIWTVLSAHPFHSLFGTGWGGTFSSPAVGNLTVNFTHSLITSIFLKTGLIGLIIWGLYLTLLFRALILLTAYQPGLSIALCAPFLINVFLYASYKSFDFGLILFLIAFAAFACSPIEKKSILMYSKPSGDQ